MQSLQAYTLPKTMLTFYRSIISFRERIKSWEKINTEICYENTNYVECNYT